MSDSILFTIRYWKLSTGNWPVKTDYISAPTYKCGPGGIGYVCHARATVCKKG